mgnify:CR=1 FL=1
MKRYLKGVGFYLILFAVIVGIFSLTSSPTLEQNEIYSDLIVKIQNGEVDEISIVDNVAEVTLKNGKTLEVEVPSYSVLREDADKRW